MQICFWRFFGFTQPQCHLDLISSVESVKLPTIAGPQNCGSAGVAEPLVGGGLGRLAAWHLPRGPVGPPARWAATSNVEVGQST